MEFGYNSKILYIMTARKRSLGQGNVFTPVCHSVHGGVFPACITGHMTRGFCIGGGESASRGVCLQEWGGGTTGYGQQAGGTYPARMHSSSKLLPEWGVNEHASIIARRKYLHHCDCWVDLRRQWNVNLIFVSINTTKYEPRFMTLTNKKYHNINKKINDRIKN